MYWIVLLNFEHNYIIYKLFQIISVDYVDNDLEKFVNRSWYIRAQIGVNIFCEKGFVEPPLLRW